MTRWICVLTLAIAAAACGAAPVGEEGVEASGGAASSAVAGIFGPRYREVTLASGTTLRLVLRSGVGSDTSNVEDTVRAELRQAVVVDGETVVPAGAEVVGVVTNAERSGRVKGRASVAYRFDSLRVDDERYDIRTASISHLAPATKSEDATKIAIGAGAGAALGAILGGGDGAAKGAAVGGGAGAGAVLATRGEEVRLGSGADVNTQLTAPVTIRVRVN